MRRHKCIPPPSYRVAAGIPIGVARTTGHALCLAQSIIVINRLVAGKCVSPFMSAAITLTKMLELVGFVISDSLAGGVTTLRADWISHLEV